MLFGFVEAMNKRFASKINVDLVVCEMFSVLVHLLLVKFVLVLSEVKVHFVDWFVEVMKKSLGC